MRKNDVIGLSLLHFIYNIMMRKWGVPVHDDKLHFALLILESPQAGLSFLTVLGKRAGYGQAFAGFDIAKIAAFREKNSRSSMKTLI